MKLGFTLLLAFLFSFSFQQKATAQVNVYNEYQLPTPYLLSPFFIGSLTESAIYYGEDSAANPNKPVVVFVHGFVDLSNLYLAPGNDMYLAFHKRGYRVVFTATSRGEGMWYNGEMLSYMLDDITAHYGVNDVIVIAHSNGGKAAEVAMFHHGKYNKVNRVITLGTPFKGTALANLAELPGFNWLADLIALGGGTATSTTYYMEGVARPILDNHPNNQPNKFINYGAWGYKHGNTVFQPAMFTAGLLLNTLGAGPFSGGNDGVTPYYSSTRPGGNQMWPGHCWTWWCNLESKHDHIDIAYDYISFNDFYPWLSGALPLRMADPETIAQEVPFEREEELASNYEILTSKGNNTFKINENDGEVTISVLNKEIGATFSVLDGNKVAVASQDVTKQGEGPTLESSVILPDPSPGSYELVNESEDYVAVVSYENGPLLVYDDSKIAYEHDEYVILSAKMEGTDETTQITATITHKRDLKGNEVSGEVYEIEFQHLGSMVYEYHLPEGLAAGVYTVLVHSESEKYRRSAVSGFVVREMDIQAVSDKSELLISHFPNPVVDMTQIRFEKVADTDATLSLFDNFGRLVKMEDISSLPAGRHQIEWDMKDLATGTYFLEFKHDNKKATQSVVVLKE